MFEKFKKKLEEIGEDVETGEAPQLPTPPKKMATIVPDEPLEIFPNHEENA